jgi:hypothetical protein
MFLFSAILLSLKCVVKPPVLENVSAREVTSVVGRISGGGRKFAGKPCLGVATKLADGTLIFYYTDMFIGKKHRELKFEYREGTVGYKGATEAVGGIDFGEEKPIPPVVPSIGFASMSTDGVITIQLRMVASGGSVGEGLLTIKPGDPRYEKTVRQIGIKPGQSKPMCPVPTGSLICH